MGVAVIFGLAFATFLTLVVLPVLYDVLLQWRDWRAERKKPQLQEVQATGDQKPVEELVA